MHAGWKFIAHCLRRFKKINKTQKSNQLNYLSCFVASFFSSLQPCLLFFEQITKLLHSAPEFHSIHVQLFGPVIWANSFAFKRKLRRRGDEWGKYKLTFICNQSKCWPRQSFTQLNILARYLSDLISLQPKRLAWPSHTLIMSNGVSEKHFQAISIARNDNAYLRPTGLLQLPN